MSEQIARLSKDSKGTYGRVNRSYDSNKSYNESDSNSNAGNNDSSVSYLYRSLWLVYEVYFNQ